MRGLKRTPTLVVLVLVAVAGCVEPAGQGTGGAAAAHGPTAFPVEWDHNHVTADHAESFAGLRLVDTVRLPDPGGRVYNLATAGALLVASASGPTGGSIEPGMSLVVVDIAHAAVPELLSVLPMPGGGVEAVAITPDARFAFLGTEFSGTTGIWTIDLATPADPRPVGFTPIPTEGPHNIRFANIGGQDVIIASISHVATPLNLVGFPQDPLPVVDLRVDLYAFDATQPEAPMPLLSSYTAGDTEGVSEGAAIVHDAVAARHPVTNATLMYVAHWDRGMRIVDVDDVTAPKEIGRWTDTAPAGFLTIHTVRPLLDLIDGRHFTLASSQCAYHPEDACHLRVFDTTEPDRVKQVCTWTLPEGVRGTAFTTEIIEVAGTTALVPWGHAGFWVLDVASCARAGHVDVLGHAIAPGSGATTPFANAALEVDGYVFVADVTSGIQVLERIG